MSRRLVAALACRVNSTRLYAKPLQHLADGTSILAQLVASIEACPEVDEVVLGVSEGVENLDYVDVAHRLGCRYLFGHREDVLARLIDCARLAAATDVLRLNTENPFFEWSTLGTAWERHVADGNDITVIDWVPLGTAYEIYTLEALERSHRDGGPDDKESASNYGRFNQRAFKLAILEPPAACRRLDLRLSCDQAEDLVLCKAVYQALSAEAPRIPLDRIIAFLDEREDLKRLVEPYVYRIPVWAGQPQRDGGT